MRKGFQIGGMLMQRRVEQVLVKTGNLNPRKNQAGRQYVLSNVQEEDKKHCQGETRHKPSNCTISNSFQKSYNSQIIKKKWSV